MNIFRKKTSKEVATTPASTASELWSKHAELKAKKYQLVKELDEVEAKLLKIAQSENLFKGKTAIFPNGRRIRIVHSFRIHTKKDFNLDDFSEKYPHLCKVSLKEAEIGKIFQDADQRSTLESLGISVEVQTYERFE